MSLGSPYQTIRKLSSGSGADVLLVRRATDGRSFAMKLAYPTADATRSVRMEHKILSDLSHPNLPGVHDLWESGSRLGLVLDYFPGYTLRHMMHHEGRRLLRQLGYVVEQCGDVMSYLHERHIYHGDVKPENILVAPGGRARLIDFSVASAGIWGGWRRLFPGKLSGTPKYMAPELIRSRRPSASADLYALGVVCYEAIAGRGPFDGASREEVIAKHLTQRTPPLRRFRKGIDPRVEALVMGALAKDPAARPRECRVFARRLARAIGSPLDAPGRLGCA